MAHSIASLLLLSCVILLSEPVVPSDSSSHNANGPTANIDSLDLRESIRKMVKRQSEGPGDFGGGGRGPPDGGRPQAPQNENNNRGPNSQGGGVSGSERGSGDRLNNTSDECQGQSSGGKQQGRRPQRGGRHGGGPPGMGMGPTNGLQDQNNNRLYGNMDNEKKLLRLMHMSKTPYELRSQNNAREGQMSHLCPSKNNNQGGRGQTRKGGERGTTKEFSNNGPPPPTEKRV